MRTLTFLICSMPLLAFAQHKYVAGYEHRIPIKPSDLPVKVERHIRDENVKYDSLSKVVMDSMVKEFMDVDHLRKMISEQFGEEMILYSQVRAGTSTSEMEIHAGGRMKMHAMSSYENGVWKSHQTNGDTSKQDSKDVGEFFFTGRSRQMLGYTCHEVKSKDTSLKLIIWVCKDLPPTISPGMKPRNIHWAVFEYLDETNRVFIILRSLKKSTVLI